MATRPYTKADRKRRDSQRKEIPQDETVYPRKSTVVVGEGPGCQLCGDDANDLKPAAETFGVPGRFARLMLVSMLAIALFSGTPIAGPVAESLGLAVSGGGVRVWLVVVLIFGYALLSARTGAMACGVCRKAIEK